MISRFEVDAPIQKIISRATSSIFDTKQGQ